MARASIKREYPYLFSLDEQEIRRLLETIEGCFADIESSTKIVAGHKFSVSCSDGSSYSTTDIEEVLRDENPNNRSINELEIKSDAGPPPLSAELNPTTASIELTFRAKLPRIKYGVEGPSIQWTQLTASRIEDRIVRLKESYSWLRDPVLVGFWAGVATAILTSLAVLILIKAPKPLPEPYQILVVIAFSALTMACAFVGARFLSFLFPTASFHIGDGIRRHAQRARWREKVSWGVFIAFLISLAAGIVTKFF